MTSGGVSARVSCRRCIPFYTTLSLSPSFRSRSARGGSSVLPFAAGPGSRRATVYRAKTRDRTGANHGANDRTYPAPRAGATDGADAESERRRAQRPNGQPNARCRIADRCVL